MIRDIVASRVFRTRWGLMATWLEMVEEYGDDRVVGILNDPSLDKTILHRFVTDLVCKMDENADELHRLLKWDEAAEGWIYDGLSCFYHGKVY